MAVSCDSVRMYRCLVKLLGFVNVLEQIGCSAKCRGFFGYSHCMYD